MQTLSSPPHYTTLSQPIITNNNNNKHFLSLLLTHSKLCSNSISTRRCRYKNSVKHLKQFLWNFREYFFPSSSSHKQQRRQYSKNFMRLCHPNCYRFLLSHHLTSIEFLCINVKREIEKYWDWFSYFPHLFLLDLEFDLVIIHHIIFIEFFSIFLVTITNFFRSYHCSCNHFNMMVFLEWIFQSEQQQQEEGRGRKC